MQYNSKAKFIYILGKIGSTHNTIETVEQMVTFVVGDHHLERYSLRRAFAPNECTCWVSDGSICTWYAIKTADTLSFNLCLPGTRWTHTWAHWFRNLKGEKIIISKNRCSCGFHRLHLMPHTIITWLHENRISITITVFPVLQTICSSWILSSYAWWEAEVKFPTVTCWTFPSLICQFIMSYDAGGSPFWSKNTVSPNMSVKLTSCRRWLTLKQKRLYYK